MVSGRPREDMFRPVQRKKWSKRMKERQWPKLMQWHRGLMSVHTPATATKSSSNRGKCPCSSNGASCTEEAGTREASTKAAGTKAAGTKEAKQQLQPLLQLLIGVFQCLFLTHVYSLVAFIPHSCLFISSIYSSLMFIHLLHLFLTHVYSLVAFIPHSCLFISCIYSLLMFIH